MKRARIGHNKPPEPLEPPPVDSRLIGYARVSTADQNPQMQIDALLKAGVHPDNVHSEFVSGVAKKRPKLALAMMDCRPGDTLVVWKLDRVGRSLLDLLARMKELEDAGVGFRSLTEGIDTTTPGGRLIMHVMGALAQFERDLIVERTREGMKSHIARGGAVGAPAIMTPARLKDVERRLKRGDRVTAIAKDHGVSAATIYTYFDGATISALRGPKR